MRALLESLGILEPDRTRREPVALPAWVKWVGVAVHWLVIFALAAGSSVVFLVIRSLVS